MEILRKLTQRFLGGHVRLGPLTLFGDNAMHFAATLHTSSGYLCVRPPLTRPWKVYLSPDATPGRAEWGVGPGMAEYGNDLRTVRKERDYFAKRLDEEAKEAAKAMNEIRFQLGLTRKAAMTMGPVANVPEAVREVVQELRATKATSRSQRQDIFRLHAARAAISEALGVPTDGDFGAKAQELLMTSRAVDALGLREQVDAHLQETGAVPYVVKP